jgi:hypothetical protein
MRNGSSWRGYVQVGCEELAEDPERPKAESLAQVLEAFLAVRALRLDRGVALDKYYVGNLDPSNRPPLNDRQLDPEMVPTITGKLIQQLRHAERASWPVFCGRNFYVALRDETLPGTRGQTRNNQGCGIKRRQHLGRATSFAEGLKKVQALL